MPRSHKEVCHHLSRVSRDRCGDGTCNETSCPAISTCSQGTKHGPDGNCYYSIEDMPPYLGCVTGEYLVVGCLDVVNEIVPIRSLCHECS